ncbi:TetR/AcrR family transcriptional regulator [bacterium]|nr:TetR/AcrR family transcriptional regulator [bacterium]
MSRGTTARREREREALRQSILQAARELFQQQDYSSVTLRKIADRIEYSPTTIYLYFKDKHALVMELIAEGFELLSQRMARGLRPDPRETLRCSSLEYLRFSQDEPHYYRLMFQLEDQELNARCVQREPRLSHGAFVFLAENVQKLRQAGYLRPELSDLTVAHLIWSALHGAACLQLGNLLERLPEQERGLFFEQVVEGLARSLIENAPL